MTKGQRQQYAAKHERRMNLFERKYIKLIALALGRQIKNAVDDLKSGGVSKAITEAHKVIVNPWLSPVLKELHIEVGVYGAKRTLRQINKSTKAFGDNPEWIAAIIRYFTEDALQMVSGITRTTREHIIKVLSDGQEQGLGIEEMARQLTDYELTLVRARLITRTELVKAMAYGHELGINDSPFLTEEIWISVHDARTRHSHRLMDGERIMEGGRFKVPVFKKVGKIDIQIGVDLMKRPGDPNASIQNLANCRCTSVVRAVRDRNGRLIRKQNQIINPM